MKILVTHPKVGTAIERLASTNIKYNPHHEHRMVEVHPKRPDPIQLERFIEAYQWCDVWDAQYWKTAEKLRELFPGQLDKKPVILTHHNPYDLTKQSWDNYTVNVVMNKTQHKVLPDSVLIPHAVDFGEKKWNEDYPETKNVLMVAQRIESKKGIEPVARACKELGYRFILVGQISDAEYFTQVAKHGITFLENVSDEELYEAWKKAAVHVCNSVDNFESGTLPILDAMAIGVPVLTRSVGLVPDIFNGKNMVVREGQPDDYQELKAELSGLVEDRERCISIRQEAWHSVRNYEAERRARSYSRLYSKLAYKNALASVILPVFGRSESIDKMIEAINNQTYPALEIIIVSDGDPTYDQTRVKSKHTLKYFRVGNEKDYGLGFARDYGVLKADGDIIIFNDQRFTPEPTAYEELIKNLKTKLWVYGNKNNKKNFVENFSCLYRQEYINMGMSNHLIDQYGGMSQELRARSKSQGFRHVYIESAKANSNYSSHNYNSRKDEIRLMKQRLWELGLQ